jgi:hypothetical protein
MTSKVLMGALTIAALLAACTAPAPTQTPTPEPAPATAQVQPTPTLPVTQPPIAVPTIEPTQIAVSTIPPIPTDSGSAGGGQTGSINGWVFHDLCAPPVQGNDVPAGCVRDPFGGIRANGQLDPAEPPIAGVNVVLAQGPCPSIAIVQQTTTVATGVSYSFTNVKPGTYCVAIDPGSATNAPILLPGGWTHPVVADGPLGITVNVNPGENKFNVNFGWDYQFKPEPVVTTPNCIYRAAFLGDVTVPDNAFVTPGLQFIKTWRVRNDGNCAWGPGQRLHQLVWTGGSQVHLSERYELPVVVQPGGVVDLSVMLVAPVQPGLYLSEWMLRVDDVGVIGVGTNGQTALFAKFNVGAPTPPPPVGCVYRAAFLGDVTIPDNSVIAPNTTFVKTWRVRNDSNCPWGPGYPLHQLVWAGGSRLHTSDRVEIPFVVPPGGAADLSVTLTAPVLPGLYLSEWKLRTDQGQLIGVGRDGQTALFTQFMVGSSSGVPIAPDTYFTSVKYVLVNQDAPIYQGRPGDTSTQINLMAAGQTMLVTGVSFDGQWWRVLCLDKVGQCWVSASPSVTQQTYLAPGAPIAPNAVETAVRYVRALTQLAIYLGEPGDTRTLGVIWPAGQTAMVTGVSYDGQWWRVVCPDDAVGNCWVSANPQQTQPTLPGQ